MYSQSSSGDKPLKLILSGAKNTLPLIIAAAPFSILYGVLAKAAGLSTAVTMAMSVLVFAGSAQFIAVSMLAASAAWPAILIATFFVNLRHILYSITLVPHTHTLSGRLKALVGFWLTDETFAVVADWLNRSKDTSGFRWYYIGSGLLMYSNWNLCTYIGITLGNSLPEMSGWGLEVAMIVAFVGIITPALNNAPVWAAAAAAALCAVFSMDWPHQSGLIVASIVGVVTGMLLEYWRDKP